MPDPFDYTSAFANLPTPQTSFLQGVQGGAALQQLQLERQQQQAALAQQAQKKAVVADLVSKGASATADDYVKAGLQVPELSKQFKEFWDMKNTAQQQSELQRIMGWTAAIDSGQPKIASDGMRAQADAIENTAGGATQESKGLRAKADQVDANPQASNVILKSMLAAHPDGKKAIEGITALAVEDRAAKAAPTELSTKQADLALKNLGIVGQKAGALATVKGVKPSQAATMFQSLAAQGVIPKDDLQGYIDGIPSDPKALPDYLATVRDAGIKPDDQKKFTTPDANTLANNATSVRTTGMNNATQIKVQKMIDERQGDGGDETGFTKELAKLYKPGSPEYEEALRQRINKEAGINAAGGGGRSVIYNGRIIASGNEVAQALRNITELPVQSNAGFLGVGQPKSSSLLSAGLAGLKNELNSDQVKTYNTMWTGVSRNLGTLETSGLATTGDLIKSIDKLAFVPGDNGYNALRKLAEVRQITEAALDPKLADPAVPPDQKKYIQGVIDAVHKAVPYTHSDLTHFERAQKDKPDLTFQDFATQTVNKAKPAPAAAPTIPAGWSVKEH